MTSEERAQIVGNLAVIYEDLVEILGPIEGIKAFYELSAEAFIAVAGSNEVAQDALTALLQDPEARGVIQSLNKRLP